MKQLFISLALALLAVLCFWVAFDFFQSHKMYEALPLSDIESVTSGPVRINGVAEKKDELVEHTRTETPAVYSRFVQEYRARDDDGDRRWETHSDATKSEPFIVRDGGAEVVVIVPDPDDTSATIEAERRHYERDGNRRNSEYRIEPGDEVMLAGRAVAPDEDADAPVEIHLDLDDGDYQAFLTNRDLGELKRGELLRALGATVLGLVFLVIGVSGLLRKTPN